MEHYGVLSTATLLIIILSLLVWRKTKSIAFLLGFLFLYFWSLYGAWFIIYDNLSGDQGERYQYLFFKLFPIYLNTDYLWTLVLYALFIIVIQLTVLYVAKRPDEQTDAIFRPFRMSHLRIILIAGCAGALSYLIIRNSLAAAAEMNASGYEYVRGEGNAVPFFTLHQLLNRVALVPLMIGLAVFFSGEGGKYIVGTRNRLLLVGYTAVLGGMVVFCMILGNRNELMFSFATGALFYIANTHKPKKLVLGGIAAFGGGALILVKFWRDGIFTIMSGAGSWELIKHAFTETVVSNEAFAAHFSMYGAISKEVPFTYGTSLVSLLTSVVPRIFWSDRPADIYSHYADNVGAIGDQGYAIHHATGWYLNFGVPGVILGALLIGWLWAKLFNKFYEVEKQRWFATRVFSTLAFWTFTAALPVIIRAGPEAYKSLIIQTFLMPTAIVAMASVKLVLRADRPQFIVERRVPRLRPGQRVA